MKKLLCIICLSFLLIGCNAKEFKKSSISIDELNNKIIETRSKIDSEKVDGYVNITFNNGQINTSYQIKLNSDIIINPVQLKALITATIPNKSNVDTIEIETYIKDSLIYVNYSGDWAKFQLPNQFKPPLLDDAHNTQDSPFEILENDTQYLLKEAITQKEIDELLSDKNIIDSSIFNLLKVKQGVFEIYIDKTTFNINKMKINAEIEYVGNIKAEAEINFSSQNEIKEIIIPKEGLEAKLIESRGN